MRRSVNAKGRAVSAVASEVGHKPVHVHNIASLGVYHHHGYTPGADIDIDFVHRGIESPTDPLRTPLGEPAMAALRALQV